MANNYYFKVNKGLSLTPQTSVPTTAKKGDVYYDNATNSLKQYNGTSWAGVGGGETLTISTGLTGGSYDGTADVTIAVDTSTIATKTFTDNTYLKLAGGTMSGDISMGNNDITGVNSLVTTLNSGAQGTLNPNYLQYVNGLGGYTLLQAGGMNFTDLNYSPTHTIGISSNGQIYTNNQDLTLHSQGSYNIVLKSNAFTQATISSTGIDLASGKALKLTNNSQTVTLQASATASSSYTITLPAASPSNNTYLTHTSSGTYSWDYPGFSVSNQLSIANNGTITIDATKKFQLIRVASSGGAIQTNFLAFGATPPLDGTCIRVMGTSDSNTVQILPDMGGSGAIMNGPAVLGNYDMIEFQYNSTDDRYVEVSRNF
jgi:hypothetical protein